MFQFDNNAHPGRNRDLRHRIWRICHYLGFGVVRDWTTVLAYHSIGGPDPYVSVSRCVFLKQVEWLISLGVKFVSLEDIQISNREKVQKVPPGILLTFDDGYQDFLWVMEKLSERSIPCVLGIPACLVTGKRPTGVMKNVSMISVDQLKEIILTGLVSIAVHGLDHRRLYGMHRQEVRRILRCSRAMIAESLEIDPLSVVYPFGSYDRVVLEESRDAGFLCGMTINGGVISKGTPAFELPRFCINGHTSPDFFKLLTGTALPRYMRFRRLFKRATLERNNDTSATVV